MADIIGIIPKTPTEIVPASIDFVELLGTDTITAKSVQLIQDSDSSDVTSAMIQQSSISGTMISVIVKLGTSGLTYTLTIAAITSLYRYEGKLRIQVNS